MVRAEEEARALAYQAKELRLERAREAFLRTLTGNPANALQIRADWEPVILANLEAQQTEEEDDDG